MCLLPKGGTEECCGFPKKSIEKFSVVKQCQSHDDGETPEINWLKGHINVKIGGITPCSGIINE